MERIIKKIELSSSELERVLWAFGLTLTGNQRPVGGGRIANNILVDTAEIGAVIVRAYPHAYGQVKVCFEADVLHHFSERGCDVPRPIRLVRERSVHQAVYSSPDVDILAYKALPGSTISQAELSPTIASAAGKALAKVIPHASSFTPTAFAPQGDLGFIAGLLRAAKERDEGLASNPILPEMEAVVSDGPLLRSLAKGLYGIVHADYFFENVLANDTRTSVTGILDFGDAYCGGLINDAIIGAMEFAVREDESWDLDSFDLFLRENRSWLARERLAPGLLRKLLLANCIRFAVYTLPFSNADSLPITENKYVKRFISVLHSDLGSSIEAIWARNTQSSDEQ